MGMAVLDCAVCVYLEPLADVLVERCVGAAG